MAGAVVVAQVDEERFYALAQLTQLVGKIAGAGVALILVRVPAAEVDRRHAQPQLPLDYLGDGLQVTPKAAVGIDGAVARHVVARIRTFHDVDGIKRLDARLVQPRRAAIHGSQSGAL